MSQIAAIACVRNEAPIIGDNIRHLIAHGVDHIFVYDHRSSDETWKTITTVAARATGRVSLMSNDDEFFNQAARMNDLVEMAVLDGAEWILPFDADEFIVPVNPNLTIAEALAGVSPAERKLYLRNWPHHDWDHREEAPLRMPKVAFRCGPGLFPTLTMGQHEVNIPGGEYGVLDMRHLQYRSFDHFVQKIRDGNQTVAPETVARGDAYHITQLAKYSEDELRMEWERKHDVKTVLDPIPVRR